MSINNFIQYFEGHCLCSYEKGSAFRNIGWNNISSFHCLISFAFSHLHLVISGSCQYFTVETNWDFSAVPFTKTRSPETLGTRLKPCVTSRTFEEFNHVTVITETRRWFTGILSAKSFITTSTTVVQDGLLTKQRLGASVSKIHDTYCFFRTTYHHFFW